MMETTLMARSLRNRRRSRTMAALRYTLALSGLAGLAATPASAQSFAVTHNLSLTSMVTEADPLVKLVMAILLMASIATWTLWIAKSAELAAAKRQLRHDVKVLDQAASLRAAASVTYSASTAMIELAQREMQRGGSPDGIKERVAVRLTVIETNAIQSVLGGVNILASIGATSPFIGLAGTVWGIMNSFIGISKAHATNLAIVAPGIAEALLATAMGLMAAIPAVLIYNVLARSIAGYRRQIAEVAALAACALSRELEGQTASPRDAEARPPARATA